MDTFKFSITPTGSQPIPAKGNFIRYKDVTNGAAASTIRVKTSNGDSLVMDPNDKAVLPRKFEHIELTNEDASETIAGRLIIGEGDFDSAQVTGTVAVSGTVRLNAEDSRLISFADDETDDENAFTAVRTVAAVAAEFSKVQIKNPAASGKVVYVDKLFVSGTAAEIFQIGFHDTDLTNDAASEVNKSKGGAAAVTQCRWANGAAAGHTVFRRALIAASSNLVEAEFKPALKLEAGEGVIVECNAANTGLYATWEFREYTA